MTAILMRQLSGLPCGAQSEMKGNPPAPERLARWPWGFTNEPAAPTRAQTLRLGRCSSLAGNGVGGGRAALQNVEIARAGGGWQGRTLLNNWGDGFLSGEFPWGLFQELRKLVWSGQGKQARIPMMPALSL